MHLQVHFILQAPWCLSPALSAHTLIRTREVYKKRGSVCPALQGSFAGTLDAPQPLAWTSSQIYTCHMHPQIHTDMYTHTDTHILHSCIQMQTHAQRHTLISALITLTISRKQACIMFSRHGSLKSQINTLIHMNIMLLWVWEVKIISFSLYLSDEACILLCSKWFCECMCLTLGIFSSGVVRSRVCVLQAIFVFLGVQILPLRDPCLTWPSASGADSVLDHVHQVQCTNSLKIIKKK